MGRRIVGSGRGVEMAEEVRHRRWRRQGRQIIHFLHIGKTGGTSLKTALREHLVGDTYVVRLHGHQFTLADVPPGDSCVFVLRDPVSRFVSGFNSRLRQGRPRHDLPWSTSEQWAFGQFASPEELGLALSSTDDARRAAAVRAMSSIAHVKARYSDRLGEPADLLARRDAVLLVGRQETLAADFALLIERLGVSGLRLPSNDVEAHRTPAGMAVGLSEPARANLVDWYAADYELLRLCEERFRRGEAP